MSFADLVLLVAVLITATLLLSRLVCLLMTRRAGQVLDTNLYTDNGAALNPGDACYPVRYCSGRRFRRPFRIVPWDATGVFVVNDTQFRFLGRTRRGESLRLTFPRNDSFISYIERMFLRDGGLSWFSIEAHGKKFFFSSEGTAPDLSLPSQTLRGSSIAFSTTGIYEKVTERFSNL